MCLLYVAPVIQYDYTCALIFTFVIQLFTQTPEREFLLRVCYMEIYNEVVRDLLIADASGLQIREDEFV